MCPPSSSPELPPPNCIPSAPISQAAFQLASSLLATPMLNHSIRVYLYAQAIASHSQPPSTYTPTNPHQHDLLFTACILHDIGTAPRFDSDPQRFEVCGADAAAALLSHFNVRAEDAHQVWMAIALHTSPGLAERASELSRLVREAVLCDFGKGSEKLGAWEALRTQFEARFERGEVEKVLGDRVVEQALRLPRKAEMASWAGGLVRAYAEGPGWEGVNRGF
ncbi:hypothetical protein BDV95DRAFT_604841 [Massariosphaeria phaeospora]|uniref:HD/PDEase domain-containing protein n=1 Tax=Massariosphaeria phaeospora TaxID=100035 RepID=A0A7C8I8I0_9PLEO|nr:hypothetical protein BDV95DRAFT_604841 [Massariosphaeria phaeospora]